MTELKPCPFCGMSVHWEDGFGIIHDRIVDNCIVDLVWPMESNMNLPKESWIRRWNRRSGISDTQGCPRCDRPFEQRLDIDVFGRSARIGWCPECEHIYQVTDLGTAPMGIGYEYSDSSYEEGEKDD